MDQSRYLVLRDMVCRHYGCKSWELDWNSIRDYDPRLGEAYWLEDHALEGYNVTQRIHDWFTSRNQSGVWYRRFWEDIGVGSRDFLLASKFPELYAIAKEKGILIEKVLILDTEEGVVDSSLEGKVAIVTGAASGIGEAAARLFAENGALVVIADIQDELGHQVAASIGPEKASYRHCDVRDEKQVAETVAYTLEKYGNLHVMFSNAGVLGPQSGILELDLEGFDNTMATNVRGVAVTMKHAARAMVARKTRGSIICTTSVAASLGGAGPHAYTMSKHALVGLVRSACSELGDYGIRVNSLSPFGVGTPLVCEAYDLEPSGVEANSCALANLKGIVLKARHIAEAALFLASDESAYISGHNLVIDGGFTVVNHTFSSL
ncbi:hypothetical protein HHK36_012173 [Tetracentron sinense]|uniref:Uncharacterized protein n=1 Tax=Tetracentron sinense TaxID=13715 RepID=A0A834ZCD5_TETSI|nr:hypothetical protein HHK36_012173 [Tetracentron sinense]